MSYKVEGTTISLTRGDSLFLQLELKKNGETYYPVSGDVIRFALKHPQMNPNKTDFVDAVPLLVREIPNNTLLFELQPSDTEGLGFGTYVYDIQITYASGAVDTFIANSKFIITPEVD